MHDLRYGLRSLRDNPGFTLTAVAMLAFGIGAVTVFFGQINAIFPEPLPIAEPARVQSLSVADAARPGTTRSVRFSYADYMHLRDRSTTFSDLGCWFTRSARPLAGEKPIDVQFVSGNYFQTLGVGAAVGRTLRAGTIAKDRRSWPWSAIGCGRAISSATRASSRRACASRGAPSRW